MTQSGEVVSHRAHNPGTGGANPSSATKFWSVLMIAIDVIMTAKNNEDLIVKDTMPIVSQSRDKVYDFFKNCIDKNLVINAVVGIDVDDLSKNKTRYFSTTVENAQAFQSAFEDMSTDFSIKKMWDQYGFTIEFEQHEINFDNESDLCELISPNGEIWSIEY
jgi:hypothetical protein